MEQELNEVIIDTAVHLELYKMYVADELNDNKEDFENFSDWREKNKEVLSWKM